LEGGEGRAKIRRGRNDVADMPDCRIRDDDWCSAVESRTDRREGEALRALEFARQLLFRDGARRIRAVRVRQMRDGVRHPQLLRQEQQQCEYEMNCRAMDVHESQSGQDVGLHKL
jgi:hypothetical protein